MHHYDSKVPLLIKADIILIKILILEILVSNNKINKVSKGKWISVDLAVDRLLIKGSNKCVHSRGRNYFLRFMVKVQIL